MDSNKSKNVGTREEVYKGISIRTAGGLHKDDIIEKKIGNKIMYISKKLSEKMKINILRTHNPNFLKKKQKQTMVNNPTPILEPVLQKKDLQTQGLPKSILALHNKKKTNTHNKTQKLSFNIDNNSIKNVYYPDLKGINLNELKEDLKNEEAEEDLGISIPKSNDIFKIEELPDIDLNDLC